jgi:hypothetical protein
MAKLRKEGNTRTVIRFDAYWDHSPGTVSVFRYGTIIKYTWASKRLLCECPSLDFGLNTRFSELVEKESLDNVGDLDTVVDTKK